MSIFSKWFSGKKDESDSKVEQQKPQFSASDYCEHGQMSLDAGKYVEAMEFFQAAIEADKHFEKAYILLATAYEKQGNKDKAKSALFGLLAVDPNNENALKRIEVLTGVVKAGKMNDVSGCNNGVNQSVSGQDSDNNDNGEIQQPQSIQVGNYRIFDGKPEDRFDFFVIFDDGNRLYFKINNANDITIVSPAKHLWDGYKKPIGMLDVPSFIDYKGHRYSVKAIASGAFHSCNELQAVRIPDTVSNIDSAAFFGCSSLSSVELPLGLERIGLNCFRWCKFDTINIPESVSFIDQSAFCDCTNLVSFKFPDGVKIIKKGVLLGCEKITKIVIPKSVIEIEEEAFGITHYNKSSTNTVELRMETTIPPKINSSMFRSWPSSPIKVTVVVPQGAMDAYITAQYWQEFNIIEK